MSKLSNYLKQLNSAETEWGIWVDPKNPTENFRIGQYIWENGGLLDDWIHIGSLEDLSFGFQEIPDAIREIFKWQSYPKNPHTRFNVDGIIDAYYENNLDPEFHEWLKAAIDTICELNAEYEADVFCEELENECSN